MTGRLHFMGGDTGAQGGTLQAATAATLELRGGNFLAASAQVAGHLDIKSSLRLASIEGAGGRMTVTTTGSLELTDPLRVSTISTITQGGMLKIAGELRVDESWSITAGTLAGSGSLTLKAGSIGQIGNVNGQPGAGVTIVWDRGPAGTEKLLSLGGASYLYGPDGVVFAEISATDQIRCLHHDRRGSIRTVTDQTGQRVGAQSFDTHGNPTSQTGQSTTFGFAGEHTDPDTGLVYLRARDYDPATGQFLTRDPRLGSQSRKSFPASRRQSARSRG